MVWAPSAQLWWPHAKPSDREVFNPVNGPQSKLVLACAEGFCLGWACIMATGVTQKQACDWAVIAQHWSSAYGVAGSGWVLDVFGWEGIGGLGNPKIVRPPFISASSVALATLALPLIGQ
jgi:hypothetical protein